MTAHREDTVKIFASEATDTSQRSRYTTAADFCRIFEDNVDRLYLLSLLLTADPDLAEKCFVSGLETARGSNVVFKEWAQSWARRTIITNAIRMVGPRLGSSSHPGSEQVEGLPSELAAVVRLNAFERFVFVMSVLEGYSERDCKLLLDCSSADVARARSRALQQLGALAVQFGNASVRMVRSTPKNGPQYDHIGGDAVLQSVDART
jgi:DNA-directed RNA polymerase specialized sigma24 family protein